MKLCTPLVLVFLVCAIPLLCKAQTPRQFAPITPHNASGRTSMVPVYPTNPLSQKRANQAQQQRQQYEEAMRLHMQYAQKEQIPTKETETIQYTFPSLAHLPGTNEYYKAFDTIVAMLESQQTPSLKDAVFLVEHAYSGEKLQRRWYESEIAKSVEIIKGEMKHLGYEMDNDLAKKMLLHAFMSGSLAVRDKHGKTLHNTTSKHYDFEDIYGKTDWTKMFVSKLMREHTGQCHSLPLLYLILAEELDTEAYLAFSPEHSYIKLKDADGNWINLELTNGHYTTDLWLLSSGYVNAEAIKSGIYMKAKGKKEIIAHCLADLSLGYASKYGMDAFVLQCVDKALEHDPANITAWQIKTNYYTYLFDYVARQMGYPKSLNPNQYPRFDALYTKRNELYRHIGRLGYNHMPEEAYKQWLQSLEEQKHLQKNIIRP